MDMFGNAIIQVDEACIKVRTRKGPVSNHNTTMRLSDEFHKFLATPRLILNGTIPTAVGQIQSFQPDYSTLQAVEPWNAALRNAMGIRCTFNFTVNVAATPFHAGILRASWHPNALTQALATARAFPRNAGRIPNFQLPGVTFNLQDTTQIQMTVPWTHNVPFMSLRISSDSNWTVPGTFRLYNLTDVTPPAGSVSPTYSVFMHMTDVELIGPDAASYSLVQPQMKGGKIVEDLRSSQAISKTLAAVGAMATTVGKIPLMPSAIGSAGWLLRKAANAASYFGFSKPIANAPLLRNFMTRGTFATNATGEDPAANLGLFHDSAVAVANMTGSDIDEQSVRFIANCPGLINDFVVNNQIADTLVYAAKITPAACFFQTNRLNLPSKEFLTVMNTTPFPAIWPSPLFGVSTLASYWKGTIKYDFYLSKTRFHTGRLLIAYAPASPDSNDNAIKGVTGYSFPPASATYALQRMVVDIRETTHFTFEVPFTNINPMSSQQTPTGSLCVYVLEPIRAPSTVTAGVRILVAASSPDLQLSGITGCTYNPTDNIVNLVAQMNDGSTNIHYDLPSEVAFGSNQDTALTREEVALIESIVVTKIYDEDIVFTPQMNDTISDTGEEIVSLGTVSRRTFFRNFSAGLSGNLNPYEQNVPVYTPNITTPTSVGVRLIDAIDFIRSAYLYERGGMVVQIGAGAGSSIARIAEQTWVSTTATEIDRATFNGGDTAIITEYPEGLPLARAYVPRYSPYPVYKTSQGPPAPGQIALVSREVGRIPPTITATYGTDSGSGIASIYGRACADDHVFSFFVGWPPLCRGDFTSPAP